MTWHAVADSDFDFNVDFNRCLQNSISFGNAAKILNLNSYVN